MVSFTNFCTEQVQKQTNKKGLYSFIYKYSLEGFVTEASRLTVCTSAAIYRTNRSVPSKGYLVVGITVLSPREAAWILVS